MPDATDDATTPLCPVERLAAEWGQLSLAFERLDTKSRHTVPSYRVAIQQQMDAVLDRQRAIQDEVSWLEPRSAAGCRFLLMLCFTEMDVSMVEAERKWGSEERMMWRLRRWIERQPGVLPAPEGLDALMSPRLDPDERLKAGLAA